MIKVKRVYDPISPADGQRFLVDRLWPRGIKREALKLDGRLKDVAPSDALRKWFTHDAEKWEEFCRRYFAELDEKPESWQMLVNADRNGTISLLYSSRELKYNNAVALTRYLEQLISRR